MVHGIMSIGACVRMDKVEWGGQENRVGGGVSGEREERRVRVKCN